MDFNYIMFRYSGLTSIAIVCMVITGDIVDGNNKLLYEIETVKNKTILKLEELSEVKKEVQELKHKIKNATEEYIRRKIYLLKYHLIDLHKSLFRNKAAVEELESSIKTNKDLLEKFKRTLLEEDFKAKLLKQEIEFYQKRKENGDENTCFYLIGVNISPQPLEKNSTTKNTNSISARSLLAIFSNIKFKSELRQAKLELSMVKQHLLIEKTTLTRKKALYEHLKTDYKKMLNSLAKLLSLSTLGTLKPEENTKKIENDLYNELLKMREIIAGRIEATESLETQLLGFKQAIECYDIITSD